MTTNPAVKYKFDFEIGNLIKSPCEECGIREKFPKCIDECDILDKIRTLLSHGVSCTYSSFEL